MIYLFTYFLGACVGSFLNVVIFRLEAGEGIVKKRSHCPKCGQILAWYDLIPIVSFFILRGQCRECGEKISWQYPLVEAATGLLFVAVYQFIGWSSGQFDNSSLSLPLIRGGLGWGDFLSFGFLLYILCSLIVIFVYDLRHYIIPDKVLFPAIGAMLIYRIYETIRHAEFISASQKILKQVQDDGGLWGWNIWQSFLPYLLSALVAAAFFLFLVLITRGRGMGLGDIKLAFLLGLMLGWPLILPALFLAFASGAIIGLALIALGKKKMKSQIPFGPFLIAAALIALFWGQRIIQLYLPFLRISDIQKLC